MSRIYIYPKIDHNKTDSRNDYVFNLENVLLKRYIIVNKSENKKGVLDLFHHLLVADVYFFNWIEELPSNRFGRVQTVLFFFFLLLAKTLSKKIIWVLHNKYSHNKAGSKYWKMIIFHLMLKYSKLIITHSNSGIDFIKSKYPKYVSKVHYFIHPLDDVNLISQDNKKEYDLFIWGTIYPYKGIAEFLKFVERTPELKKLRILIAGVCPDPAYKEELKTCLSKNIIYKDNFYKIEQIAQFAGISRFILFTYNSNSVLSSGSLMDSIRMGVPVIGPSVGAFKDLESYSFMYIYKNYDEIVSISKTIFPDEKKILREIENFCSENSWGLFGEKLSGIMENVL